MIVVPPGSVVEGRTIGEWGGEWWNWNNSMPNAGNPIADPTGANANNNQNANVFFIAGTGGGPATRSFNVPIDRPLLIPLINAVYYRTPEPVDENGVPTFISGKPQAAVAPPDPNAIEQFMRNDFLVTNPITRLFFEIDGVAIPQSELLTHLEASRFTAVITPGSRVNALSGEPPGSWTESFSIGYYVMLEPLAAGTHTLRFGGTRQGGFSVDVTATLTAVPEPSGLALFAGGALILAGFGVRSRLHRSRVDRDASSAQVA